MLPTPSPTNTSTPTATPQPDTTLNLADVVEQARAGVVRIEGTTSSGSGFVVDADGYILTNEHVINAQSRLTVVFDNGARLTARVIASDASRDIALLKVSAAGTLTVLPFATSVRVGDEVIALGHPLNLGMSMSVTDGIISAFRTIDAVSYIQTSAPINPGNSGGPLLNLNGEVVGMNTSAQRDIQGEDYFAQGIGFAIKFDELSSRLTAMKSGHSSPPTLVPTPTSAYVLGPQRGSIQVEEAIPNLGFASATVNTDTTLADFIVDVTFTTPSVIPRSTGDFSWEWSPCVILRARQTDAELWQHSICFYSSGLWSHFRTSGKVIETATHIDGGISTRINSGRGAANHVRVIATGEIGFLFFNGEFEAELDLSGVTRSGETRLVVSSTTGTSATRYSDFTVRSLQKVYGPRLGSILHNLRDRLIDTQRTFIQISDGIIEADFSNPYASLQGDWSNGFEFRNTGSGEFHIVAVQGSGHWFHHLRSGDTEDTQILGEEFSSQVSTRLLGSNHIRVIALGDEGWLFINGVYTDKLDLSGLTQAGEALAITNYFTGDGIAGYSTRFEDFIIWSAD